MIRDAGIWRANRKRQQLGGFQVHERLSCFFFNALSQYSEEDLGGGLSRLERDSVTHHSAATTKMPGADPKKSERERKTDELAKQQERRHICSCASCGGMS